MAKTIEQIILEKGFAVIRPKGASMYPLLTEGNTDVCIVRAEEPLQKYDVALYLRDDGTYVLHRVMSVDSGSYTMCGDNQWTLERGIEPRQIIGRLDSWYKDNKKHTVRDASYLRYTRFWCMSLGLRRFIIWCRNRLADIKLLFRAAFRKIFKR